MICCDIILLLLFRQNPSLGNSDAKYFRTVKKLTLSFVIFVTLLTF